jgi:signal transduction histidine kinase
MRKHLTHTLGDRGNWAFIATVLAAYVPVILNSDWANDSGRALGLVALGLLYLLIGTLGFERVPRDGTLTGPIIYCAIQLALATLILYIAEGLNLTIIIILPLAAHSVTILPRRGVLVFCLSLLAVTVWLFNQFTDLGVAIQASLSIGAGILFVVVFTQVALNEQKARAEIERLAAELRKANLKLREYAAQIEELATTRERNRIAREIHDGLGHYLTVVNMQIQAARAVKADDPARADEALGKAAAMAQEALADIRRSVAALRSAPTDNKPLGDALKTLADECRAAGIQTTLTIEGQVRVLPPQAELTLYRATQEALTNVQKHAHASAVTITLDYRNASAVTLTVQDNGIGNPQPDGGFGLLGVRERAQLLNGKVTVTSNRGSGFELKVELPTNHQPPTTDDH